MGRRCHPERSPIRAPRSKNGKKGDLPARKTMKGRLQIRRKRRGEDGFRPKEATEKSTLDHLKGIVKTRGLRPGKP
jgi:hypothetical protein